MNMTSLEQFTVKANLLSTHGLPNYWAKIISSVIDATKRSETLKHKIIQESDSLYSRYKEYGYFPNLLLKECIGIHEYTNILFFVRLYRDRYQKGEIPISPVAQEVDDRWMRHASYCFFNIRATGRLKHDIGNMVDATRLLPAIRTSAIHLGPFFQSVFGIIYAQASFEIISDEVTHSSLEASGISRYEQLSFFVDCCHLLGKTVGFDLTPHTCGFSKVNFDHPELFRWLRWNSSYEHFYQHRTEEEQYQESIQKEYAAHIRQITQSICADFNIEKLEDSDADVTTLNAAHEKVKLLVRAEGYFPMVPHTWNGIGLPGVHSYCKLNHHPIWDYRNLEGEEQSIHSIGLHALFKFHTNILPNRSPYHEGIHPDQHKTPEYTSSITYLAERFPHMHRTYGFDFLRIDYQDHVFRNLTIANEQDVIVCEQLTASQLNNIAKAAKNAFPPAGLLADHVGYDVGQYRQAGFNLILGKEVQYPLCKWNLLEMFDHNLHLIEKHRQNPAYGTSALPIDTHDMGHWAILGSDLPQRENRALVMLRHFFSRFATGGIGSRPKYETMGNQDMSSGIYRCNNEPGSLKWGEDLSALTGYHLIEDTFEKIKSNWMSCELVSNYVYEDHCWWIISSKVEGVSYLFLSWYGDHYDFNQAMSTKHKAKIPLPCKQITGITKVLGIRPANTTQETDQIKLGHHLLSLAQTSQSDLYITWPNLTKWVIQITHE